MRRPPYERKEESPVTILTREQDRALRAAAWRHVRRINRETANRVYATARARQDNET